MGSLATRFIPHAAMLSNGPVWINQIESLTPEDNAELFEETAGSETDTEFVAERQLMPTLPIATSDLTILSTVGFAGLPLVQGTNTLTAFARELPLGALPTAIATAHHITLAVSDGLIVPTQIRAQHNQVAKLGLMVHAILGTGGSSGATPFVYATAQTITSGTAQVANIYT